MRVLQLRLPYRGLFLELTSAICAVVAIAFAVNAWMTIVAGRGPLLELIGDDLDLRARAILQQIERHLDRCADELSYWSRLETFDDILIDDRGMHIENLLISLQRENEELFEKLSVIDRGEIVIASTEFIAIGEHQPLASLDLSAEARGQLLMSDFPKLGSSAQQKLVMVHPIVSRLDTEPIGWIVAEVAWRPIERLVAGSTTVAGSARAQDQFLLLLDDQGHLLAAAEELREQSPNVVEQLTRVQSGDVPVEWTTELGTFLVSRQGSRATTGTVAARLQIVAIWEKSRAYSVVTSFMMAAVGSAILGLFLAAGASFVIARMITKRVRKLAQGTRLLAEGDLGHRVEEGRDDEIGRLARSFNSMAGRLAEARDDLEEAAARWHALVANAPDLVLTASLDGTISFMNRTVAGVTEDRVVGSTIFDHVPDRHHEAVREVLRKARRTGEPQGFELEVGGPDGEPAWYSIRVGPIKQDSGVAAFTIIVTDVTYERRMERDILEVSEQERERIGRDLHDDLGQILTGISLLSKGLQKRLATTSPEEAQEVGRIDEFIKQAISQTRALARGLLPIGLDKHGLQGALEELSTNMDSIRGVHCSFDGVAIDLERSHARHLYRITQEAVNNALKHGEATQIQVRLTNEDGQRMLVVTDNGKGIPDGVDPGQGMGLRLMKYRASKIGGSLTVRRGENGGTVVRCRF